MLIEVKNATPRQIDWMVSTITNPHWDDEDRWMNTLGYVDTGDEEDEPYFPTENWGQGGPILADENIGILPSGTAYFMRDGGTFYSYGETPLIAAMRAVVCCRLAEFVAVPESFDDCK